MSRACAATTKQRKLTTKRRLHTHRHTGISNLGVPNHVPKAVTSVCASERRVSARRRLTSAWQVVWPRARGSHFATQGCDASRSDGPTNAVRAQGGVALSVTGVFQKLGYRNVFPKREPFTVQWSHTRAHTRTRAHAHVRAIGVSHHYRKLHRKGCSPVLSGVN